MVCFNCLCADNEGNFTRQPTLKQHHIKDALKLKGSKFSEQVYKYLTRDGKVKPDAEALSSLKDTLHRGTDTEKIKLLFQLFDAEGKGYLDSGSLRAVLCACMDECSLHLSSDALDELTDSLMEEAGGNDVITYAQLEDVLRKRPGIIEGLTQRASCIILAELSEDTQDLRIVPEVQETTAKVRRKEYWRNHAGIFAFAFLYLMVNVGLFCYAQYCYWDTQNALVLVARGCGKCLNFNCALIVLTMQRHLMSWLRQTRISFYLPLDQHLIFHIVIAVVIVVMSVIHGAAHVANFTDLSTTTNFTAPEYLFTTKPNIGWFHGSACITGWLILVIYLLITVCSLPCVRRSGHFEVFYYTHMLIGPAWILLVLHSHEFWCWFLVPGIMYIISVIVRSRMYVTWKYGTTKINEVVLLPSEVTHLVIQRPTKFRFYPGDYVYVNIPSIARNEWHPFTISSAPEQEDSLWLHIRAVGKWTERLRKMCESGLDKLNVKDKRTSVFNKLPLKQLSLKKKDQKIANMISTLNVSNDKDEQKIEICSFQRTDERFTSHRESSTDDHPGSSAEAVINKVNVTGVQTDEPKKQPYSALLRPASKSRRDVLLNMEEHRNSQSFEHVKDSKAVKQVPMRKESIFEIYIDGPYGASSSHIAQAEHAVLIGAGIGVTPFASILQSLWFRYREAKHLCPSCGHNWTPVLPKTMQKLKRVDFFWINRHQRAFEWFVNLLSQLELEQSELGGSLEDFLRLHMYVTSAPAGDDFRSMLLQLALEMTHRRENRDHITGLRTRTHAGRPDWEQVFSTLAKEHKGRVTIFYCGPPSLGSMISNYCVKYNFCYRHENF